MAAVVIRRTSALGPRASALFVAAVVAGAAACSSPPPGFGGGGGHGEAADRHEEPVFNGAPITAGAAEAARERIQALKRFLGQRGVTFDAAAESPWVALDGEGALIVTIQNHGEKKLTLLGERRVGTWPFGHEEHARASLQVATTQGSLANGIQGGEEAQVIAAIATQVVAPGGEADVRLPFAVHLAKTALAASVSVRAEFHPLSLQFEGEPERVCSIPFDAIVVRFGPPRVAAATAGDGAPLESGLADDPELLVAAALRAAESDPAGTVGRLVTTLPGPDAASRRARIIALEWITQRRLGDSVERWRGWWDSDEGMRFGRDAAKSPPAAGGER